MTVRGGQSSRHDRARARAGPTVTKAARRRLQRQPDRRGTCPRRPGGEERMAQPKPALPSQPRLRSLAGQKAEIVKTETNCAGWAAQAVQLEASRRDARAVRGLLEVTEARLTGLNRSRAVLLEGDAGRDDEPEDG